MLHCDDKSLINNPWECKRKIIRKESDKTTLRESCK